MWLGQAREWGESYGLKGWNPNSPFLIVQLHQLPSLGAISRWRSAFFVSLVQGDVLVLDFKILLDRGELDGDDPFAVVDWLANLFAYVSQFGLNLVANGTYLLLQLHH